MNPLRMFFRIIKILELIFVLFVIFVVVRGGILARIEEKNKAKKSRVYYTAFNKFFKGTVVKIKRRPPKKEGKLRDACYTLKLIESSSRYYNPSKRNSEYFCVIDFPYAEVMAKDFGDVQIGDTCYFNGTTDCLWTKVANKKWRGQRPEIGKYAFLNKPYTSISQYDSVQLMWRRYLYPEMEHTGISQIQYYWKLDCKKRLFNKGEANYNSFFYNYSTWERDVKPEILSRQRQPHFYMIQVDEYKIPLDLDSLTKRYKGESILWIKHKQKYKYFINRQILRYEDAKKYLKLISRKFKAAPDDKFEIRKIKNRESVTWFDEELDKIASDIEPDIQVIPKPKSFIDYSWIIFVILSVFNVFIQYKLVGSKIKTDKIFAKGFRQYAFGLLFFVNLWLMMIGIGLTVGWVDSIFDFIYVENNPIIIVSNVYLIILLFGITRWILVGGGSNILATLHQNSANIFNPLYTEGGIVVIWFIYVLFGIGFIFARLLF